MQYTLIANSVTPDQVEERTIDGRRHLVAKDVTFIRPMRLAGGYVPREHVANSAPDWDRSPLTINHPKNLPDRPWYDPGHGGYYVSANKTPEVREQKVIGHAQAPSRNGDGSVAADLAVDVEKVESLADGQAVADEDVTAAEQLLEALQNGESFNVSSQYFPNPLPAGEYDGAHRDEVEAIANTDSIALLPTKDGVCSLEDGCGFQPEQATANADADTIRAPVANADSVDVEVGDRVTWASQGDRPAAGVVREVIEEGRFDTELGGDSVVTAPAALIRVFKPASGDWERSTTMVAHKPATVTVVDEWPDAGTDDPTGARSSGSDTDGMRANKTVGGITYTDTATGTLDESELPDEDFASHYVFDSDTKSASGFPLVDAAGRLRRGNVAAAFRFRDDAPDVQDLIEVLAAVNNEFDDPPIESDSLEDAMTGNASGLFGSVRSFLGWADNDGEPTANEPAESGVGCSHDELPDGESCPACDHVAANSPPTDSATEPGTSMERDTIIEQITANSNIKRESLEGMGDQCLQNTHEHVVANAGDDDDDDGDVDGGSAAGGDGGQTQSGGGQTLADMTVDDLAGALDDQGFVTEDELGEAVANAQQKTEKEERVERIIANSKEYAEDDKGDLMETPGGVLEDIESGLSSNASLPGATGSAERATANASGDDADEYTDGTIGGGA